MKLMSPRMLASPQRSAAQFLPNDALAQHSMAGIFIASDDQQLMVQSWYPA
jgi:hypothetical protein